VLALVENYNHFKYTFHSFFCVFIAIIGVRMYLFFDLKYADMDSQGSDNACVWRGKAITKADQYYFYVEELVINLGIIWYSYIMNKKVDE
jgi:hypothetical protein